MIPAARLAATIDVLADIAERRRPAADALKDWGLSHRFAGSGDRAGIAGMVYDALRRRASAAWLMGADTPRAIALGMLVRERGMDAETVAQWCSGQRHAPAPLSDEEMQRLQAADLAAAPPHVLGDYPAWLDPHLARSFGEDRAREGAALAARAPIDLRVNSLKADRAAVLEELAHLKAMPAHWSPLGVRIAIGAEARNPAIQAEPAFIKGEIEVQDEGSQLAALFAAAAPGEHVVDLCAGGGGKTLALAAMMDNHGQLYATDNDKRRLAPIHERLARAGVRNVQIRTPRGTESVLADLRDRADLVLIDAPCTGTGVWRRNPDAKWRMRPGALEIRRQEQAGVLDAAVPLVRPGGRIVYVTCSVLAEENDDQIVAFRQRHTGFALVPPAAVTGALGEPGVLFREAALMTATGVQMSPRRTGTDGFFVAVLQRNGAPA